jgi:NADPH-dependent 2,4-dienoyl-CoA reductase/sulfur reductase-like enzyme/nitrite reductase/ring-hydroxylating ferredoxin subunit
LEIGMSAQNEANGPDFATGIPLGEIPDGSTLSGRVGDTAVLLSKFHEKLFAVSGTCTHYGAPLSNGLIAGQVVRCPLHHACFSLRTGAALSAPALDPVDCWRVDVDGGTVFVRDKLDGPEERASRASTGVERIIIIGGGAAGLACANELRRLGYTGAVTMISADPDPPCDRPNLSKDFLAGTAPEDWLPLRSLDWYAQNNVDLLLGVQVQQIDVARRRVQTRRDQHFAYDRLLLATGSEPNRLQGPGFDAANVLTLRSVADARDIAMRAKPGTRAAIVGSSFIGMEAAAALRKRDVAVTVVSPEPVPFERTLGSEIGHWLRRLHERHGVRFHLGTAASSFDGERLQLENREVIDADFVVVGIGVRPRADLARAIGISATGAVPVDAFLETRHAGVFAAGDIAEYPDPLTGEPVRIEHWVTAEGQGQVAAANMLAGKQRYCAVPFFWTEQFGLALRYVGHARTWDETQIDGDVEACDFIARYFRQGRHCASAAVGRDFAILEDEQQLERDIAESMATNPERYAPSGIDCMAAGVEAMRGS